MNHPSDRVLIDWFDQPVHERPASLSEHVASCAECCARIDALEPVFEALRSPVDPLPESTVAAQRERIVRTIGSPPASSRAVPFRTARWWIPAAAAATIAALVLFSLERADDRAATGRGETPDRLAVVSEADRAAEDAITLLRTDPGATIEDVAIDVVVEAQDHEAMTRDFAALTAEAQDEILDALAKETFDL